VFERFATRAFRRPAAAEEIDKYLALYKMSRGEGDNFEQAIRLALEGVLVSPQFLFRIETDPADHPERPHPVSDYELATRLSYFLWSSMPDDELFALAESKRLHDAEVLDAQVKRMLADGKSGSF